jgi:hypothetical protein
MTADKQAENKQKQPTEGNGNQKEIQPNSVEAVKKNYGENFQTHLLEQYKLYVEMMDRVSARRAQTNTFYISLLSGLLALLSLVVDKKLVLGDQAIVLLATAILGLALCYVWYANINSYKELNSLKFKVINEIEPYLPFPCYLREWEILKEGNKNQQYRRLTRVEKYVPFILAVPYLCLLVYSIYSLLI